MYNQFAKPPKACLHARYDDPRLQLPIPVLPVAVEGDTPEQERPFETGDNALHSRFPGETVIKPEGFHKNPDDGLQEIRKESISAKHRQEPAPSLFPLEDIDEVIER